MTTVLVKKYNPLEMSSEDVLALATGREKLLDIILSEMKVCLKKGSNQHFVLHGPRGIGKSFFTKLLKIHHDQSDDFRASIFYQLPEEQENINFAADLLDVIATLIEGGKLIDTAPKWTISDIQWQKSKQRLKEAISNLKETGISHVFVTQENLQTFIPKLDKIESSRLREFLSDFNEITIIGSSLRPDLDNDYSKRLFHVFKKLDIEPWTTDDFLAYYDKLAHLFNYDDGQLENLKKSKNKIKAISKFTGGSPRLAVILSKLILEKNILETAQLLDGIIDELTTYYQDITNDIPAKSKILFDMLIRKGENMTQSALAAYFEPALEQKDIARSFAWLTDNYYVVSSKQAQGNTKYFYVRDRLYVLYYQKRQIYADVPFSFVGVFVDFLNAFYTRKEKAKELGCLDLNHDYALPVLSYLADKEGLSVEVSKLEPERLRGILISKYTESSINKTSTTLPRKKRKIVDDVEKGNSYFEKGDYEKAIMAYEKAIERNPEDAGAYKNLGITHTRRGDYERAITAYEIAIERNPEDAKAYFNLGYNYGERGDYEKAITAYEKAIELNPEDAEAYFNLGYNYGERGDYEKAIMAYEKAIELNPEYANAYYNLGYIYSERGDYEKAITAYEKAIELNPEDAEAYFNLGYNYGERGDYEKAIMAYEKAIELNPEYANAYYNLGYIYSERGDYEKAITAYEKAIELNPEYAEAYNSLGNTHTNRGDYERAITAYEKAIELNPEYANAYYNLGYIYSERGDYEKAITAYEKAIELNPEYAEAYNSLGNTHTNRGDYERAITAYEKAIELNPEYSEFYNNLGITYQESGDIEKAISIFLRGLKLNDSDYELISKGLSIIIKHQQWNYLDQFYNQWNGDKSFSSILGESLYGVIKEDQSNKFFYFKNTIDALRKFSFINFIEVINGLCIELYKDGNLDFLRQVVDEVNHDFAEDKFVQINLEVYKYLLNQKYIDINTLHPDVRTVVQSILSEK